MNDALDFLARHALDLAAGTTVLLAAAALAAAWYRSPLHAQRLCEAGLLAALAFVGLALLPLPRPLADWAAWRSSPAAAARPLVAHERAASATTHVDRAHDLRDASGVAALRSAGLPVPEGLRAQETADPSGTPAAEPLAASEAAPSAPSTRPAADTASPAPPEAAAAGGGGGGDTTPSIAVPGPRDLVAVLLLGSGLCLAWMLAGAARLGRLLAASAPAPGWVAEVVADVPAPAGLRLRVTTAALGPFCTGLGRPVIVLPADLCRPDRRACLRAVLLHELGHARAGDGAGRLLLLAALPVLWWHPLFWWLRHRARLAAELRADEHAALHSGRAHYARRLLDLAAEGRPARAVPLASPSILGSRTDLSRRIEMLMQRTERLALRCSTAHRAVRGSLVLVLLATTASLFGSASVTAQDAGQAQALSAERDALRAQLDELNLDRDQLTRQLAEVSTMVAALRGEIDALREQAVARGAPAPLSGAAAREQARAEATRALTEQLAALQAAEARAGGHHQEALEALLNAELARQASPGEFAAALREAEAVAADELRSLASLGYVSKALADDGPADPDVPAPAAVLGDALHLLERAHDQRAEAERLAADAERLSALVGENLAPASEADAVRALHRAAQRKLAAIDALLAAEAEALALEVAALEERGPADASVRPALVRLKARLALLTDAAALGGGVR